MTMREIIPGEARFDLLCIGIALVDCIIKGFDPTPVSASGYRAASSSLKPGGEALNESIAAAKLGMRTAVLCSLGEDAAGDIAVSALRRAGVETDLIQRSVEHPTPITTMFVNEDGTRRSVTNSAHRYNFHPERYCSFFKNARALILGSLFRAPFDDPSVIHAVLAAAADARMTVFADTKLPNFRVLSLADLEDSFPLIDYITPNEDEARYYTGEADPESMADCFLRLGVRNVIIKLGGKGCLFKNADASLSLPAYAIRAVDATGAGDNFIAGFASEILRGSTALEALRFANACGAICTTAVGAGTALQNREQVLRFMSQTA